MVNRVEPDHAFHDEVEGDDIVHDLIVDTKNWWPGKKVLISPRWIREIDWMDNMVKLNVDRERVQDSPAYDVPTKLDWALHETFP